MEPQTVVATEASQLLGVPRPYRSHKIRACDLCRKRKVRCYVDIPGRSCVLCRSHDVQCQYRIMKSFQPPSGRQPRGGTTSTLRSPVPSSAKPDWAPNSQQSVDESIPWEFPRTAYERIANIESRDQNQQPHTPETSVQSKHIVGPVAAQDAQIIEQFMSPDDSLRQSRVSQTKYGLYSADPAQPVLYTLVPRRREGLSMTQNPGSKQRAVLDQILMSWIPEIINSFFEQFNPSFPMLDNAVSSKSYNSWNRNISQAVVCDIFAVALTYWNQSRGRQQPPCADHRFVWNLAVKALQDDFMAPGLSTVQAALLDLTGRPICSMTGNGITNGKTLSFSYSLGLNRDPSRWNLSESEKDVRIRMWWGVLIHDRWGSFAHGTPPHIFKGHYDVPLPQCDLSQRDPSPFAQGERRFECFLALCSLTDVLGDLLPLIYDLKTVAQSEIMKKLRRLKMDMDLWEDSLPEYISMSEEREVVISGSSSLRLGFLAMKMLISRVELHAITHSSVSEARSYHQAECRNSAKTIVNFAISLKTSNLHEFWLPYSAYHLGSTATLLLRCALETTDDEIAESCISHARRLVGWLRRAKEEHDWDLADFCLLQCEDVLYRMTATGDKERHENIAPVPMPSDLMAAENFNEATLPSGVYGSNNGPNVYVHDLWDMFRFEESDFS